MRVLQAAVCALTIASAAQGQEQTGDPVRGEALYERHCASCHGFEARGGGPLAPALVLQPTNLTGLSAANDGVFPLLRVIKRIDGRDPLVSHGSPMPVFGPFFEGREVALKTPSGQPILTSEPIVDLVSWLKSIQ